MINIGNFLINKKINFLLFLYINGIKYWNAYDNYDYMYYIIFQYKMQKRIISKYAIYEQEKFWTK
jgi:hypothetical protein